MTVNITGVTPGVEVDGSGSVVNVTVTTGGGGGGVTVHNLLTGRDAEDAHPIGAITGLQDALDNGGVSALADLTDVDVTSDPPAQDDVLAWDDTENKWTPATLDGGVALSDAAPQDLGTAAAGVSTEASRADHVHDMPTAADVGALPDDTVIPDVSGLQATSAKDQANGYPGLDSNARVAQARLGSGSSGAGTKFLADDQTYKTVVQSSDVDEIVVLTQAEYDALTPPDDRTFYVISDGASAGGGAATLPTFSIDPMVPAAAHTGWATFGILSNAWNNWNRYSSGTLNDFVVFQLPGSLEAGTWTISIGHLRSTNAGIYTFAHSVDGSTWTSHGTTIDGYNGSISAQRSELTGVTIPDGTQFVRLRMTGKNASSSSHVGWLNFIGGLRTGA